MRSAMTSSDARTSPGTSPALPLNSISTPRSVKRSRVEVEGMSGRRVARQLIRLLEACYLALELGRIHFGLAITADPGDRKRLQAADRMYALKLQSWVRSEARSRITDNI